jgi:hypothetical protein
MSNFRYFDTDLSAAHVSEIFLLANDPTKNKEVVSEDISANGDLYYDDCE